METAESAGEIQLVDCTRNRLRITLNRCVAMYQQAKKNSQPSGLCRDNCLGCQVGAQRSGDAARSIGSGGGAAPNGCVRCLRAHKKLVHGMHCPSCYNRLREFERGYGRRAAVPQGLALLSVSVMTSSAASVQAGAAASAGELALQILRRSPAATIARLVLA